MNEWIKCKDRMPENLKTVLVCSTLCHNIWDLEVCDAYWHEKGQAWFREGSDRFLRKEEVISWMPLPEPPND